MTPDTGGGSDPAAAHAEIEWLRRESVERERRLWELEAMVPAAVSRTALLRSMAVGVRDLLPRRRPTP